MTDKKNKKNTAEALAKKQKDDVALYRIIILLLGGMIGFPLIGMLGKIPKEIWDEYMPLFCICGWVLVATAIFVPVYFKKVLKKNEDGKLITSFGIGVSLALSGFIFALYPFLDDASGKFQIAFIMVILTGCVYHLYTRGFFEISVSLCVCMVFFYFINVQPFTYFELFLNYFCKIAVFPVSICGLVLTILKLVGVKEGKKFSRLLPDNRFYAVISAVVWGSALAAAALLIAFSASFVFILTYFIVLFIVLGIICTIKLL